MDEKKEKSDGIEIWRNFLVFHNEIITQIESSLKNAGCISLAWYDILIVLERSKEKSLTMKDLIKETVLTKSGVSKIVDRIEEGKLLSRKKSPLDARSVSIQITDQGSVEVRRAWTIYKLNIEKFFLSQLNASEKNLMASIFSKLRSNL
ncbi:DNA-binding MarR family transcriptional regulator [Leptospira meyeri]|uniref:DNA-binding MarR family transcriptional regulator n=1 Tax=Leptospira meyeri TaxID=29508 RepID=A0A4R8MKH2_LEPME|nr:helix-turn-helix domain-containing protein [Leptospira meyeri]EKJ87802.1 MarR family protein [Leptospira meyeri serovar Hardjo str. Went 5]TDY67171.1 DNA-binding MarR family transcriptional regulator [Leptospira meyeri]TGL53676.1 MarR family transcriptional regulator [Leptospira meyeri]